jgi:D-xylose reductase
MQMGKLQNDTWGLGYIYLYLIHFPVALEYIEPSKLQYPVRAIDLHGLENYC